jgi:hypothetical protein
MFGVSGRAMSGEASEKEKEEVSLSWSYYFRDGDFISLASKNEASWHAKRTR